MHCFLLIVFPISKLEVPRGPCHGPLTINTSFLKTLLLWIFLPGSYGDDNIPTWAGQQFVPAQRVWEKVARRRWYSRTSRKACPQGWEQPRIGCPFIQSFVDRHNRACLCLSACALGLSPYFPVPSTWPRHADAQVKCEQIIWNIYLSTPAIETLLQVVLELSILGSQT